MPLNIETFSNAHGGNAFFKAISHPLAAPKVEALRKELAAKGSIAIYDPLGQAEAFAQFYDMKSLPISGYYVQDVEKMDQSFAGHKAKLITELPATPHGALWLTAFDAGKMIEHIRHLLPSSIMVTSFDALRLPATMMSDKSRYISAMNFATNFVFFRDAAGHHTRLATANYWGGYGAASVELWCQLYDGAGKVLATWQEALPPAQNSFALDSAKIRARFNLPEFTGQLFVHALGIAGHDVIKYALDTYGDAANVLSCTHDANSWPADYYAGLPAPDAGEEVVLWVQNSQPFPIPAGEIGLNIMGDSKTVYVNQSIAPFATKRLATHALLPDAKWPQQIEVVAGKYVVRPRYEVLAKNGRQRIAHVNVERTDLKPDPGLVHYEEVLGKGHILPAPILPLEQYQTFVLPTPMARGQNHLPLGALIYDANGEKILEHAFGNLPRNHAALLDIAALLKKAGKTLPSGRGHVELIYDFKAGKEADGWLHGLFRYVDVKSGHVAESSFGSHIFNTVVTYKNEPQSYIGIPPGLSARLFLRLGRPPYDTFCHLIYPASAPRDKQSDTKLILYSADAREIAQKPLHIPCSGSHLWRVSAMFSPAELAEAQAGDGGYVIIRDTTCRLFGYHGLLSGTQAFSLDHMFGF